ncbi:helix-turn-helix domain-containing protein [Faecalispora sporosphaeroides]|jgi:transcriptional regulator with XRE-family HTH domain|uniref:Helix-turn-helix transcriptional regulator n=2 Tax=Faecalispora sporosphaeroides TaxID=1549 RepID=A0A928KQ36_9FIRM|nr:helix-turn-helix transcriptional regulator [Faecalispora sporosphaeroides]MBE6832687.1 helix-turn-helix transcriptional regulator [Faecalispora sporosphaeroides]
MLRLVVSRQTVSKWETDQTVPDLTKTKLLCELYRVSYDQLISGNTVGGDWTSMDSAADEID